MSEQIVTRVTNVGLLMTSVTARFRAPHYFLFSAKEDVLHITAMKGLQSRTAKILVVPKVDSLETKGNQSLLDHSM